MSRVFFIGAEPNIIIPKAEGPNGVILTDVRTGNDLRPHQNTCDGPEEILPLGNSLTVFPILGIITFIFAVELGGSPGYDRGRKFDDREMSAQRQRRYHRGYERE